MKIIVKHLVYIGESYYYYECVGKDVCVELSGCVVDATVALNDEGLKGGGHKGLIRVRALQ